MKHLRGLMGLAFLFLGNSAASADCLDTLNFFLPKEDWKAYSGLTQISWGDWNGGGKLSVKGDAHKYEYHVWDSQYIYLHFDSTDWPEDPYSFDDGHWMPRWWCVGQSENVSTTIRRWQRDLTPWGTPDYTWSKNQSQIGTHNYKITFADHTWVDMGGNIGWTEVIVMHYDRPGGWEEFTYSNQYGWVKWVQNDGQEVWMNWVDQPVAPDFGMAP